MKNQKLLIIALSALVIIEGFIILNLISTPRVVKKEPIRKKPAVLAMKGKIAIVIDDWGYHKDTLEIASQIKFPFTAAILPGLKNSNVVAEKLNSQGKEIILHLPMEPKEKLRLEQNTLLTSMDKKEIKKILKSDLDNLIYCKGISNHMGSAFTSNKEGMQIVLTDLKDRDLYFLDSYVTSGTVVKKLAQEIGIKYAQRDIFLDNKNEYEYIKTQIYKLKARARLKGAAIGIGHDRMLTLEILKELMPEIAKEGYKFVFVSNLTE